MGNRERERSLGGRGSMWPVCVFTENQIPGSLL